MTGDIGIKCAELKFYTRSITLNVNHDSHDLDVFLTKLDVEYNNGFGGQNLEGVVWLADGTWLERGEYDGSEWWERKILPEIPHHLKN